MDRTTKKMLTGGGILATLLTVAFVGRSASKKPKVDPTQAAADALKNLVPGATPAGPPGPSAGDQAVAGVKTGVTVATTALEVGTTIADIAEGLGGI